VIEKRKLRMPEKREIWPCIPMDLAARASGDKVNRGEYLGG
jgi:hypothetical protein